jgi:uncharacterized protein YycO
VKIRLITGISLFVVIVALLYVFILSDKIDKTYNSANYCLSENEKSLLQDGDIILRRGYGLVSSRIIETLKDTLDVSHCGIIVQIDSCWSVIHSIPGYFSIPPKDDGVIITSLSEFIENAYPNSIIVTRLKRDNLNQIAQKALNYAERRIPFDYDFNYNDTTSLYCSELILRILEDKFALTPEILRIKNNPPLFSVFTDPDFFETIIKGKR